MVVFVLRTLALLVELSAAKERIKLVIHVAWSPPVPNEMVMGTPLAPTIKSGISVRRPRAPRVDLIATMPFLEDPYDAPINVVHGAGALAIHVCDWTPTAEEDSVVTVVRPSFGGVLKGLVKRPERVARPSVPLMR